MPIASKPTSTETTTKVLRFFFGSSSPSTGSMVSTAPFNEVASAAFASAGVRGLGAARRAEDGITVVGISTGEE